MELVWLEAKSSRREPGNLEIAWHWTNDRREVVGGPMWGIAFETIIGKEILFKAVLVVAFSLMLLAVVLVVDQITIFIFISLVSHPISSPFITNQVYIAN